MSFASRGPLQQEEPEAETGQFGCPLLLRGHRPHPVTGQLLWRCQNGWALRTDFDVARCAAVAQAVDCWKVHPERADVVSPGTERNAETMQKASAD